MSRPLPRFVLQALTPAEREQHLAILGLLRVTLPQRALVFHVPNGIEASAAAWNRVERLGAVAGFPDIAVALDGRLYTQEVKTARGRLSPAQEDVGAALDRAGIPCAVVRDPIESLAACERWGLPVRRMQWHGASPVRQPPPPGSHAGILLADWAQASSEAVVAMRQLAIAAPEALVWQELHGMENRLRSVALDAFNDNSREHRNASTDIPPR